MDHRSVVNMDSWVRILVDWVDIRSVTGTEGDYGDALSRRLFAMGFDVERQDVAPGRFNVLARAGRPEVVLCTHQDTVPGWFGVREDREFVHGRGSCDAKGLAASMVCAAETLRDEGAPVALLFVVGEEVTHDGAHAANEAIAKGLVPGTSRAIVNGEPTDMDDLADVVVRGSISELLPAIVG